MSAIDDVAAERQRQIEQEGWSPDHDDDHMRGDLARAGACYALQFAVPATATAVFFPKEYGIPLAWPWTDDWWKPKEGRRNLVRAAALIVAEIERIDRNSSSGISGND